MITELKAENPKSLDKEITLFPLSEEQKTYMRKEKERALESLKKRQESYALLIDQFSNRFNK